MNIYQLNPSNNFLWANHIKSDTPKQQKSCSESWSPQKKNNSQVEKKDLGHKCFECKETFKSFGTPKLGSNPSHAGEKLARLVRRVAAGCLIIRKTKVGELDWIERYWKWFGWYGYTVTKKNTTCQWTGTTEVEKVPMFSNSVSIYSDESCCFYVTNSQKRIVVKNFWLSAKTMPAFSTSNLHLTYHTGSNASNQRYQHYSITYIIYRIP